LPVLPELRPLDPEVVSPVIALLVLALLVLALPGVDVLVFALLVFALAEVPALTFVFPDEELPAVRSGFDPVGSSDSCVLVAADPSAAPSA